MSFFSCFVVVLGGAIGTFARYAISILALPNSRELPLGTMLDNQAGTDTIVHWHGQLPDWKQDGFPWLLIPTKSPSASEILSPTDSDMMSPGVRSLAG
jgi:hypothetical protein